MRAGPTISGAGVKPRCGDPPSRVTESSSRRARRQRPGPSEHGPWGQLARHTLFHCVSKERPQQPRSLGVVLPFPSPSSALTANTLRSPSRVSLQLVPTLPGPRPASLSPAVVTRHRHLPPEAFHQACLLSGSPPGRRSGYLPKNADLLRIPTPPSPALLTATLQ